MVWLIIPLFLLLIFLIFFLIGYFSTPTVQDNKVTQSIATSLKKEKGYDVWNFLFHWMKAKFNWHNLRIGVVILLTFSPLFIATHPYTIIDYNRFLSITITIAIILSLIVYFKIKPDTLNMLGYAGAIVVYIYMSVKAIDIYADKTVPSLYIGTVTSKTTNKYYQKGHEYTSYILGVRAPDGDIRYVDVIEKFYNSIDENYQVQMCERNGAIGLRWIEDIKK
ncbi:MAG: hypothetical protein V2A75_08515 [Pseudomonadota bacterium]